MLDSVAGAKQSAERVNDALVRDRDDMAITRVGQRRVAVRTRTSSALKIDVETRNGVVSMYGPAPTAAAKDRATTIAKAVKGVASVNNDLTVKDPDRVGRADPSRVVGRGCGVATGAAVKVSPCAYVARQAASSFRRLDVHRDRVELGVRGQTTLSAGTRLRRGPFKRVVRHVDVMQLSCRLEPRTGLPA